MKKLLAILVIFGMLGGAITVQAMDLARYSELKAAGEITFQKVGNRVMVISKNYDSAIRNTELDDNILPVDRASLARQRDALQVNIDQLNLFLKDYDAAVTAAQEPK